MSGRPRSQARLVMPALDPIVSLSVALAEAPGTCAFFLGSGVSSDAGVPTGWQVMRDGLHRLHQLELSSPDQVSDNELDAWLKETGREHITYSALLELIAPDAAVRREYLAGFFEGITLLAELTRRWPTLPFVGLHACSSRRTSSAAGARAARSWYRAGGSRLRQRPRCDDAP